MQSQEISIRTGSIPEALRVATPLVIAASGTAVKLFVDRIMVSNYSGSATAASLTAGIFFFMLVCFWLGAAGYAASFVAQYIGADRKERVGVAVWQGVWLGLLGGALVATGYFWAQPLFDWLDHDPAQKVDEVTYFRLLCPGAVLFIICQGLLGFWNGRGKTWAVTGFEIFGNVVNLAANYALIFGSEGLAQIGIPGFSAVAPGDAGPAGEHLAELGATGGAALQEAAGFFFAPLGIAGSAWGTNLAGLCELALILAVILRRRNREAYGTWPEKKFDFALFKRLLVFGVPNGVQFLLDIAAFNIFVQLQSSFGAVTGMASSIAFGINSVAFIPMCGLGMTASIFVGQAVGARKIPLAKKAVRSCLILVLAYMSIMGALFLFWPGLFLNLFPLHNTVEVALVHEETIAMLRYIAAFLLFDGLFILYSGAIKGAGDTKFCMWVGVSMAWLLFAVPCFLAIHWFHASIWTLWAILVAYVMVAGLVFYGRYRRGKWQKMRVIEE